MPLRAPGVASRALARAWKAAGDGDPRGDGVKGKMMPTKRMRIGGYSKSLRLRSCATSEEAVAKAMQVARAEHADILVKPVGEHGRWHGFRRRANARGANHPGDYEFLPTGRRAKKRRVIRRGGRVLVTDHRGVGEADVEQVFPA